MGKKQPNLIIQDVLAFELSKFLSELMPFLKYCHYFLVCSIFNF